MKKIFLFIIFTFVISGLAFGSPLPDLILEDHSENLIVLPEPEFHSPQIDSQLPVEVYSKPQRYVPTKQELEAIKGLSGAHYFTILKDWGFAPQEIDQLNTTFQDGADVGVEGLAATASTIFGPYNMVSDNSQDAEPAVMATNRNGLTYVMTSYIKIVNGTTPRLYFSTTTDLSTYTRGAIPMPAGYQYSADPLFSKNAYSSGVAPGRVYLTGFVYNGSNPPSGIAVWRTDSGGVSWSQATLVAVDNTANYVLDKPAITVSWYSGTRGHVYVAYIRSNRYDSMDKQLFVARSTDGGITFGMPVLVATGRINGSQVLVNGNNGHVYVLWTDFEAKQIKMATSTNNGQNWSSPETVATGNMLDNNSFINGPIRVGSLSMARFNWVANKICVVWNEFEAPGSQRTDIYYTAKSLSSGTWQSKVRVNDNQTNDQFMPALDFDTTGNLVVTFYDRRDDPANFLYHVYMARINSSGGNLQSNTQISTFQSDARKYSSGSYLRFIGDYQDVWNQQLAVGGEYYFPVWIGIPSTNIGDVYLSGILP